MTAPLALEPPVATVAVNVNGCPTTAARRSGMKEANVTSIPPVVPSANSVPPLSVNTVPSGPMTVGTYGSPIPGDKLTACESEFAARSQR